jgi:hypothetical protein
MPENSVLSNHARELGQARDSHNRFVALLNFREYDSYTDER